MIYYYLPIESAFSGFRGGLPTGQAGQRMPMIAALGDRLAGAARLS